MRVRAGRIVAQGRLGSETRIPLRDHQPPGVGRIAARSCSGCWQARGSQFRPPYPPRDEGGNRQADFLLENCD